MPSQQELLRGKKSLVSKNLSSLDIPKGSDTLCIVGFGWAFRRESDVFMVI